MMLKKIISSCLVSSLGLVGMYSMIWEAVAVQSDIQNDDDDDYIELYMGDCWEKARKSKVYDESANKLKNRWKNIAKNNSFAKKIFDLNYQDVKLLFEYLKFPKSFKEYFVRRSVSNILDRDREKKIEITIGNKVVGFSNLRELMYTNRYIKEYGNIESEKGHVVFPFDGDVIHSELRNIEKHYGDEEYSKLAIDFGYIIKRYVGEGKVQNLSKELSIIKQAIGKGNFNTKNSREDKGTAEYWVENDGFYSLQRNGENIKLFSIGGDCMVINEASIIPIFKILAQNFEKISNAVDRNKQFAGIVVQIDESKHTEEVEEFISLIDQVEKLKQHFC